MTQTEDAEAVQAMKPASTRRTRLLQALQEREPLYIDDERGIHVLVMAVPVLFTRRYPTVILLSALDMATSIVWEELMRSLRGELERSPALPAIELKRRIEGMPAEELKKRVLDLVERLLKRPVDLFVVGDTLLGGPFERAFGAISGATLALGAPTLERDYAQAVLETLREAVQEMPAEIVKRAVLGDLEPARSYLAGLGPRLAERLGPLAERLRRELEKIEASIPCGRTACSVRGDELAEAYLELYESPRFKPPSLDTGEGASEDRLERVYEKASYLMELPAVQYTLAEQEKEWRKVLEEAGFKTS